MVRLSDVVAAERANLEALECPDMPAAPIQPARALSDCRVALISSAGLMRRGDKNVPGNAADYRTISSDTDDSDILMNHISVNFDRSAYTEDLNSILPRDRLAELAQQGVIGAAAEHHYSFMGATGPEQMKANVDKLIDKLDSNRINTVCLLPV